MLLRNSPYRLPKKDLVVRGVECVVISVDDLDLPLTVLRIVLFNLEALGPERPDHFNDDIVMGIHP